MSRHVSLSLWAALVLPFGTASAVNWNELTDGDLSDDGNLPTFISFTDEHNIIEGTMGFDGFSIDRDIWTFTIASGYELTAIDLVSYSAPSSGIDSFMAIASGSTINTGDSSLHLSNALWTEAPVGNTNLLALLEAGPEFGGLGFTGTLGAGTYTFWVQETSEEIQYCIDFVVTPVPVPEPGSALLIGLGALACLRRRRPKA